MPADDDRDHHPPDAGGDVPAPRGRRLAGERRGVPAASVGRPGPPAAYASNWKTVLWVDAALGTVPLAIGVVLAVAWNPVVGGFVASAGLAYLAFVAKRAQEWRILRRDAGL